MNVPTFARIAAGEEPGAKAFLEGKIQLDGDFQVAMRLAEMFGQPVTF
jgi:putative sterol carrier protein